SRAFGRVTANARRSSRRPDRSGRQEARATARTLTRDTRARDRRAGLIAELPASLGGCRQGTRDVAQPAQDNPPRHSCVFRCRRPERSLGLHRANAKGSRTDRRPAETSCFVGERTMANYHHYDKSGSIKTDIGSLAFDNLTDDLDKLRTAGDTLK